MFDLFLASGECDVAGEVICAPANVLELFEANHVFFSIGPLEFTRTVILIYFAMFLVLLFLYFGLRGQKVVPTKFGVMSGSIVDFVRNDIAKGVIGAADGAKYTPYLLTLFLFILVGNLFEITPLINFPITSRMAIPGFLSATTWVLFVFLGFKKNGLRYFTDIVWPKAVPVALRPLVGLIELVSTFLLRPVTLAVRLFANLVAGHLMLTLLLLSGYTFLASAGDIGFRALIGVPWYVLGLGIWLFELLVAVLQAYIFTLLSAVYIESSLHPAH